VGVVYLIHFDRPYKHARHYMGFTRDGGLDQRLAAHAAGRGARLMEVIDEAGITWRLARTWENAARRDERRMKGRGLAPLCPICRDEAAS
jgi:predicted GIY-YIG superfamily endonuclease